MSPRRQAAGDCKGFVLRPTTMAGLGFVLFPATTGDLCDCRGRDITRTEAMHCGTIVKEEAINSGTIDSSVAMHCCCSTIFSLARIRAAAGGNGGFTHNRWKVRVIIFDLHLF